MRPSMLLVPLALSTLLLACGDKDDDTGSEPADADGDGYGEDVDCNDGDDSIHPDAAELCDGVDNDCDGLVDDADDDVDPTSGGTWYGDADLDGYGDDDAPLQGCTQPSGTSTVGGDCDDGDATVNPGAEEICNDVDDDCDGDVDGDAVDAIDWWGDADGDGYGDPADAGRTCAVPEGAVTSAGDCDDADADVHPGAEERCNGIDDDCDAETGEDGVATWEAAAGGWTDLTADATGTVDAPAALLLDEDGTLRLCDGTWYATIETTADVRIESRSGDPATTILDGGAAGSVVSTTTADTTLEVQGLTLQNGTGTLWEGFGESGGGIYCEDATLELRDSVLQDSTSTYYGAGLMAFGCETSVEDTLITGNAASGGAGVMLLDGNHSWTRVEIVDNTAGAFTGGLYMQAYASSDTPLVALQDVVVSGNSSASYNSGAWAQSIALRWIGTEAGASALTDNHVDAADGVEDTALWLYTAELDIADVDFGEVGSGDDNDLPDVWNAGTDQAYEIGDGAAFTCDEERCGEATVSTVGNDDVSEGDNELAWGNIYLADDWHTLESVAFYVPTDSAGDCSAELAVLSSDSLGSGLVWDVEAMETLSSLDASGWQEWDLVGTLTEPGRYYAAVIGVTCTSGYAYITGNVDGSASTDSGLGTAQGYVYAEGIEDGWENEPLEYLTFYAAPFYTEYGVVDL